MDRPLRAFAILFGGAILAIAALQHSAAVERRDAQVAACDRGNEVRARQWTDITQDAEDARALAGQEHDPEIAEIWRRRARLKQERADAMIAATIRSGAQLGPELPTVNCEQLIPAVDWNPL